MTISHWESEPAEWDRLVLGPYVMPGVWDIDFACRRAIDVKKSKGKDGASFTDEGYEPPLLELIGKVATSAQWTELQAIIPKLHPKQKGKGRDLYTIQHPKVQLLGIATVYVTQVKAPSLDRGILTVVINAIEWVAVPKPVKKTVKPPLRRTINDQPDYSSGPNALNKGP